MSEEKVEYGLDESLDKEDIDFDNLTEFEVLLDMFGEDVFAGVDDMAKTVGQIHALCVVGIEPQDALEYLLQLKVLEHDKATLRDNNELQLKVANIDGLKANKNEI